MRFVGMMVALHSFMAMRSITANVAPLRERNMMKRTATTKKAHAVFTAERVTMVCREFDSPRAFMASIVPVAEVIPGIIDTSNPASDPVIIDSELSFLSFLLNVGSLMSCFGMVGCVAKDVRRVGKPNKPDNAGKRTGESSPIGDSTLISRMIRPKTPDKMKINKANPIPANVGRYFFVDFSGIRAFSVPIMRIVMQKRT